MRYRVNAPWPAQGGAVMVAAHTIIDDAIQVSFKGVIPPWNVTHTRDWLVAAYREHPVTIPPVEADAV
jgi:hypothetical protein